MTEAVGSSEYVQHLYQNSQRDISKRNLQERACYFFFRFCKKLNKTGNVRINIT